MRENSDCPFLDHRRSHDALLDARLFQGESLFRRTKCTHSVVFALGNDLVNYGKDGRKKDRIM